jgi:drug/metabolite transporter (DMT)-like permease
LGLLAAVFWGSTDFISRFPSRKIGSGYSTAYVQLFSLIGFSAFIIATGFPSLKFFEIGASDVMFVILAGVLNVFGLMQLYRAFSIGNMSLSAPIGSSYPIFTILLGFVFLGQGIGLEKGVAIALVIFGVALTGLTPEQETVGKVPMGKRQNSSAVVSALTAAIFFGAAYLCLDAGAGYLGSVLTIWLVRTGAVIFAFPFLILTMRKVRLPGEGAWKWLIAMAILDSAGFAALTFGYLISQSGPAIVTTLSSLLGAVTTILATIVYKDRLSRIQIFGIVILFLGVIIALNA